MLILIRCRISKNIVEVTMDTENHLYDLLDKLIALGYSSFIDEETKFVYKCKTYYMSSRTTFEKIGMKENSTIIILNQAYSG